jgi:hypothetical protein
MATYVKNQLYMVPLAELQPDPTQPRKCQEQIELSGFVANELSAFSVLQEGSFLRTGGERRMFAFLASYSCAGVIHSHFPAALAEHGGKWLWVTPSVRLPFLLV